MRFKLKIQNETYEIVLDNCEAFFNDDALPIKAFDAEAALKLFATLDQESFAIEYYEDDCESCPPTPRSKKRLVPFIEGHIYVFTLNQEVVFTSVDPEYVSGSFDTLLSKGLVNDSYIVSLVLCPKCQKYQIEVEQCEM